MFPGRGNFYPPPGALTATGVPLTDAPPALQRPPAVTIFPAAQGEHWAYEARSMQKGVLIARVLLSHQFQYLGHFGVFLIHLHT